MRRFNSICAGAALAALLLPACYGASALRQSERIVAAGFDFDARGPWILLSGPGSLLVAGGALAIGSVVPLTDGVDPREPEVKWFQAYRGPMRPGGDVAILCHADRSTWVAAIRELPAGEWREARHEKWHFPACIEALPGSYDLEVHYFLRAHAGDREQSVARQAESTRPSIVRWETESGWVYRLSAAVSGAKPSQTTPPQRHIPRSRALGTTWWGLEESEWRAQVEPFAPWEGLEGMLVEQRSAWQGYAARRP